MSQPKPFDEVVPQVLEELRPGQRDIAPTGHAPGRMQQLARRRELLREQATDLRRQDLQRKGGIRPIFSAELTALLGGKGRN